MDFPPFPSAAREVSLLVVREAQSKSAEEADESVLRDEQYSKVVRSDFCDSPRGGIEFDRGVHFAVIAVVYVDAGIVAICSGSKRGDVIHWICSVHERAKSARVCQVVKTLKVAGFQNVCNHCRGAVALFVKV